MSLRRTIALDRITDSFRLILTFTEQMLGNISLHRKQFNNANLVMLIAMVLKTEARRCLVCHSLTVQYENSLEVPQSRGHDVSFSNLADLIVHFCYPFLVTSWHFPSAFARTVLHAIKIKTSSIYIDRQFLVLRFWIFSKLVSLLQFLSQHQVRSESYLVTN